MKKPLLALALLSLAHPLIACSTKNKASAMTEAKAGRGIASELVTREELLSFATEKLKARLTWTQGPQNRLESKFKVEFFKEEKTGDKGDSVKLIPQDIQNTFDSYLWMPEHDHGSRPVKVEKTGVGVYVMTKTYFTMPGNWDLHLQIKDKDQATKVIEEQIVKIKISAKAQE